MRKISYIVVSFILMNVTSSYGSSPIEDEEDSRIFFANSLQRLSDFIESRSGREIFKKDFEPTDFSSLAKSVHFSFNSAPQLDQFGNPKCLLNFEGETAIQISTAPEYNCIQRMKSDPAQLYFPLLHEVLNMMKIERPLSLVGSIYDVSKKILAIDPAIIETAQKILLHPTCEVWTAQKSFSDVTEVAKIQLALLKAKGYVFRGAWPTVSPSNWYYGKSWTVDLPILARKPLVFFLKAMKPKKTRIFGIFSRFEAELDFSLLLTEKDFNPWIVDHFHQRTVLAHWTAVVSVKVDSETEFQEKSIILDYRRQMESQVYALPSCVKYQNE